MSGTLWWARRGTSVIALDENDTADHWFRLLTRDEGYEHKAALRRDPPWMPYRTAMRAPVKRGAPMHRTFVSQFDDVGTITREEYAAR